MEGSRRRSWKRPDGEFRFREQVYENQSGLQAGDGEGGISEVFWDALQNTLDDTRDNEAVPFELDTMIQIMFHSPNRQVISTKMTPARTVKAHALCEKKKCIFLTFEQFHHASGCFWGHFSKYPPTSCLLYLKIYSTQ
jgi:hypothetical protein